MSAFIKLLAELSRQRYHRVMLKERPRATGLTVPVFDDAACEREPIHSPGAVQPHGAILAVLMDTWLVSHASANLESIIGRPVEGVLGRPLGEVIGEEAGHTLWAGRWDSEPTLERVCHLPQAGDASLRLRSYRSGRHLCIDIEPIGADPHYQLPHLLARVLQSFARAHTAVELCELAVVGMKAITGYDRVMAYRFGEDGHGEVIAEARETHLEPFIGLHYPASDVPPQVRQLYLRQPVGAIADARYTPVPLLTDPRLDDGLPLDLTRSALRSVSPVHREYMRNMKTAASLTVGLAQTNDLWGMLVCHHTCARIAPPEVRAAAATLGQVVSLSLQSLDDSEVFSQRLVRNAMLRTVVDRIAMPLALPDALASAQDELLYLVDAAGAVLHLARTTVFLGRTPARSEAEGTLRVMRSMVGTEPLALDDLGLRFPELADAAGASGGALLLPLALDSDDAILWFRPELTSTVTWGGDPRIHGTVDLASGRISPRASFAAWEQTSSGRCAPWTQADLAIAQEFRTALRAEVAQRTVVALKASAARLGLLAEHSGVVVALANLDGTRLFVSPASERVLGWCPEDIVGRNVLEFVHPDDHKVLLEAKIEILAGAGQSSATYRFRRPDGSWLWVDGQARLRDGTDGGTASQYIVVLRDATERKEAEAKLIDALRRMEQMANTVSSSSMTVTGTWRATTACGRSPPNSPRSLDGPAMSPLGMAERNSRC